MGNVLMYTLLMAGIAFAIGFFVAFIIKLVFSTIQRMMRVQTVEYKTGMHRVRHINNIRKQNYLSSLESVRDNGYKLKGSRLATKEAFKFETNEIVEYYYGKH
jgi:hypothetical protein